jgi:hypothetical protein
MRKLPRHLTVRVERGVAENFHAAARAKGLTASDLLRQAVAVVITAPAGGASVTGRAA